MSDDLLRRNQALRSLLDHARSVVEDGVVTEEEARRFHDWLAGDPEIEAIRPARLLALKLRRIFADGRVTPAERREILHTLQELTGESSPVPPEEWGKLDRG